MWLDREIKKREKGEKKIRKNKEMRNRINYVTWQEGIKKREINLQFSLPLFGRIKK